MTEPADAFIGIDVGTGSVRAGLFDRNGRLIGSGRHPIRTWREAGSMVEQSSDDIWAACGRAIAEALTEADLRPDAVRGIGFDATCSLVVLDAEGRPLAAGPSGADARNVIVWMDHRALDQTERINADGHPVLAYVGSTISPEMQTPKLLWLKEHMPETYAGAGHFFDLTDYLTWRATGSLARSVCTVTCKWTYLAHERRWADDYFTSIGLGDLPRDGYVRIGSEIVEVGAPLGRGLTSASATELGLAEGTAVGAGLIDAHAGALGTIGGRGEDGRQVDPECRIAFIMGTSTCCMAVAPEPRFAAGVWGPYFSAMLPGLWLAEGGQSAAGAAIDHLIKVHPAYGGLAGQAEREGTSALDLLDSSVLKDAGDLSAAALAARDLHVLPDFLGNRSPFADPEAKAAISGLSFDSGRESLARLYVAGLCGLGYGSAQILDALVAAGYRLETIVASGGAARSRLVRQLTADATGLPVAVPETSEPVLLGAAMLGAVAAGSFPTLTSAMKAMSRDRQIVRPAGGRMADFHRAKRAIFEEMQMLERRSRETMGTARLRATSVDV